MNWQDKIYSSITEVSIGLAAKAAGNARLRDELPGLTGGSTSKVRQRASEPAKKGPRMLVHGDERGEREKKIKRIKAKFTDRAIRKHGEAGTTTVLGPPGEVPAELGGGKYERTKTQVPKRTLYSGGRREYRSQTVDRKFTKATKK